MRTALRVALFACGFAAATADARPRWIFDATTGLPTNFRSEFTLTQDGQPTLEHRARFASEPFTPPIYWALRLARGDWALEVHHHKLYLRDPPPEIEGFSITHGFNMVTAQRAFALRDWQWRLGAGAVLAHPESTVRGLVQPEDGAWFGDGHRWSGPVALVGIGRRFFFRDWIGLGAELRLSVAPVQVPVAEGEAEFTNVALHLMVGLALRR